MVTQVMSFCQFHSFIFFVFLLFFITLGLNGCSLTPLSEENSSTNLESLDLQSKTASSSVVGPFWFLRAEQFRFYNHQGSLVTHPFFDYDAPDFKKSENFFFYPLTPQKSYFVYDFDLSSGHRYKTFSLCSQNDVWDKYKEMIIRPSFTEGIIPRLLDEQGKPQRVIVFGNGEFYRSLFEDGDEVSPSNVRLIGATYEQFCRNYPCLAQERWTSRLILIAIDERDDELKDIKNFAELKSIVDWDYVLAYLQNGKGRTLKGHQEDPAYRILGELNLSKTKELLATRSYTFSKEELLKLRKNCEGLYESIYSSVQALYKKLGAEFSLTEAEKDQNFLFWDERNFKGDEYIKNMANMSIISKRNVWKYGDELLDDLHTQERKNEDEKNLEKEKKEKEKVQRGEVAQYMKVFLQKYLNPYATCGRYVRPSNLNSDSQRHWFFTHLSALVHVYRLGYYYNCSKRTWLENTVGLDGKLQIDPYKELERCTNYDIDPAFSQAVNILVNRAKNDREHYAYIEYDNGEGGSHENIQSWVYFSGKMLSCLDKKDELLTLQSDKERTQFPEDVKWIPFIPQHNYKNKKEKNNDNR